MSGTRGNLRRYSLSTAPPSNCFCCAFGANVGRWPTSTKLAAEEEDHPLIEPDALSTAAVKKAARTLVPHGGMLWNNAFGVISVGLAVDVTPAEHAVDAGAAVAPVAVVDRATTTARTSDFIVYLLELGSNGFVSLDRLGVCPQQFRDRLCRYGGDELKYRVPANSILCPACADRDGDRGSTPATVLASKVYVVARLAHYAIFVAGILIARTVAFFVGACATLVIVAALL